MSEDLDTLINDTPTPNCPVCGEVSETDEEGRAYCNTLECGVFWIDEAPSYSNEDEDDLFNETSDGDENGDD